MKKYLLIPLVLLVLLLSACSSDKGGVAKESIEEQGAGIIEATSMPKQPEALGSDRDAHGCIVSAGYTWCEAKNKCLRLFEEGCTAGPLAKSPELNGSITSSKLGIKVSYYSDSERRTGAKEEGNRLYFFINGPEDWRDYKSGQYLEVFDKESALSFQEAIEKRFLQGISRGQCFVNITKDTPEYQLALIDYPDTPCADGNPAWTCNTCPDGYSRTNGIAYFLYFKENPEKFFYVSIGQYSLLMGNQEYQADQEWFNNIEFLK